MLTSLLTVFAALASVQVLLVVKLADFLTEGADSRAVATGMRRPGIA